jgi:hypothetical protein
VAVLFVLTLPFILYFLLVNVGGSIGYGASFGLLFGAMMEGYNKLQKWVKNKIAKKKKLKTGV